MAGAYLSNQFKLLFLFILVRALECSEPHCSKFHYEEQLLEKIIRLEIKLDTIEKDIRKSEANVVNELASLREERENLKEDFETLKNVNEQKLTSQSDEIKRVFKIQEAQISRMSEDLQDLWNVTVKKLSDMAVTPTVAFKAHDVVDASPTTGQIMVFRTTHLNAGQGYNNVTGIFTAPVGGVYLFSVQLCNNNDGKELYYDIVVDDKRQTRAYIYDRTDVHCATSDAIAIMEQGTRAWVKFTVGSSSNLLYIGDPSRIWNSFSGLLIHE